MTPKPASCAALACPGYAWDDGQGYLEFEGPPQNGVVLVGEAGGEEEAKLGRPFVGASGRFIAQLFQREGLDRRDFGVANVLSCHPEHNDISTPAARAALATCPHLGETLARWRPKAVVALGATAFQALTGEVLPLMGRQGVRGYPFWSARHGCWVVPTLHPAFILRGNQRLSRVWLKDIQRALALARDGMPAHLTHYLCDPTPNLAELWAEEYLRRLARAPHDTWLAYDIETPMSAGEDEGELDFEDDPTYTILRLSFAYAEGEAMTIPWRGDYMAVIRRLLESQGTKLNWNGRYDNPRLLFNGMSINGPIWDMMLGWHVLNSDLEKGLGFVAPFYVPTQTAWKHLSGAQPEWYSATDADVTWRIARGVVRDLHAHGLWQAFDRHVVQLDRVLDQMSRAGMPLNVEARKAFSAELQAQVRERDAAIEACVPPEARALKIYKRRPEGVEGLREIPSTASVKVCSACGKKATKVHPCVKKGEGEIVVREEAATVWGKPLPFKLSTKQLTTYQAVVGHKPVLTRDKQRRVTFDEDAMKILTKRYPKDPLYPQVVERREVEKLLGTLVGEWDEAQGRFVGGMPVDKEGRVHTIYLHNPSTLRLSSANPNMQNVPSGRGSDLQKRIKQLFVAEPGCVLLEIDYSAIEAVLVGYFAGSASYIRLAKLGVHDFLNSHILFHAKKIGAPAEAGWPDDQLKPFLKDLKKRFKTEREIAKRVIHGGNYGMTPGRMNTLWPEYFPTIRAASDLQWMYYEVCPEVKRWQNRTVDQAAERAHLRNPFGYRHWFWNVKVWKKVGGEWESEWGEDAKRALAFLPQSTAAGIIKEAMLRIAAAGLGGYLRLQIHDSLVCQIPERTFEGVSRAIFKLMVEPCKELVMDPKMGLGPYLAIGAEAKMGTDWGGMKEVGL